VADDPLLWTDAEGIQSTTLSTRVVLASLPIPRALVRRALSSVADPEVPKITFEDGHIEENPSDPDYGAAQEQAQAERMRALTRLFLARGLEIVTTPPDVAPPENDSWIEELAAAGIAVDVRSRWTRRLDWLELYACRTDADLTAAFNLGRSAIGILESEVLARMSCFPGLEGRGVAA